MTITPQGPTPVGSRNRASTIPAQRRPGPSADEWAWNALATYLGSDRCELCGERIRPNDEAAEMYDPAKPDENSVVCHAQCGIDAGLEVA